MFHNKRLHLSTKFIVSGAIYIVVIALVLLIAPMFNKPAIDVGYGDLTGRFDKGTYLSYKGHSYAFRSNDIENTLVIGVDGELSGQADFLLLMSVDKRNKVITPIILDRDTLASVRVYGPFGDYVGESDMQLCLAQTFSGRKQTNSENTLYAASKLLNGIPIHHYITMDIQGIALLNDAVGGVKITLSEDFSHIDPEMREGETITLSGKQAEIFVRSRMNMSFGTNRFRMQRQVEYINLLIEQFAACVNKRSSVVDTILDELEGHLDTDFYRAEIIRKALTWSDYVLLSPVMLPGKSELGADDHMVFIQDNNALTQILVEICYEKE